MVVQAAPPTLPGYAHLLNHSDISSSQRGELLLGELQCVACHESDPASVDRIWVRQAPDLSAIGSRVTPKFLTDYLKNSQAHVTGTLMPNIFHASGKQARDGDVEYLTHFLTSLGGGLAAPKMGGSDTLVQKGDDLFHSIGCVACHGPQREDQEDSLYKAIASSI